MNELEKLKKENEELKKYCRYLIKSCRIFCHLRCKTFNPEHKLNLKISKNMKYRVPKGS